MNITLRSAVTGITALAVASVAAFFSVVGISKLFGGSPTETMIMGAVLEAGKLVCASMAYVFFKQNKKLLLSAFTFFTVVMMLVTSIGIYGFLSSSYKDVAQDLTISETKIESLEEKQSLFNDRLERYDQEREILLEDKTALRSQLQNAQEKYNERGWATDKETVERIQDQIRETQGQVENLNEQIAASSDSIALYKQRKLELQTEDMDVKSKLGPVIQTAELFGISRDKAVLIFIAMIMLVFDPMAVLLVIAFNVQTGRHSDDKEQEVSTNNSKNKGVIAQSEALEETPSEIKNDDKRKNENNIEAYKIHNLKPTPSKNVSEIQEDSNESLPEKDVEMFDKAYEKVEDSNEITREDLDNIKKEIEDKKREKEEKEIKETPRKEYHIGSNGGMKVK